MVWPQIACLIAIKKQRPHIPKNNKKRAKQTMPWWRENTEAIFMKFRAQLKDTKQLQQSAAGKWKMGKISMHSRMGRGEKQKENAPPAV